jgi:hypothetical protein
MGILEQASKLERGARIDAVIRAAVAKTEATYLSAVDIQCPNQRCITRGSDGVPYLFDTNHFTHEGAAMILAALRETLDGEPRRRAETRTIP